MHQAVIVNDTRTQLHHGCELVMANIVRQLKKRDIAVLGTCNEGRKWSSDPKFVAKMRRSDLIIVNGEGTIHHGRPAGRDLLTIATNAKSLGIPSYLINCTYQDNPPEYCVLLEQFLGIYVRESMSHREISDLGLLSAIVPDLTLCSEPMQSVKPRAGVGITDSTFVELSKTMYGAAIRNNWEFLPVLRAHRFDGEPNLVELLRLIKFKANRVIDQVAGEDLNGPTGYLSVRNRFIRTSVSDYLERISDKALLVTARFHSMCFCLLSETPFVALRSNSHKIESMMADIGLDPRRLVDEAMLVDGIEPAEFVYSEAEIRNLRHYMQSARQSIDMMYDEIAASVTR